MRFFRLIIFWISIGLLFLLIGLTVAKKFMPLEFESDKYESFFEEFRFWAMPIAILFTLTGTLRHKDSNNIILGKTILTILLSLFTFFIMFFAVLDGLCIWSTDKILYENFKRPSTKIALRDFGCGAVDSESPTYGVFKIKKLPFHLVWINRIDTTQIDRSLWRRVEGGSE